MTGSKPNFSHIVITGASSGIGAALAHYYARPGVLLSLTGRDEARLNAVAEAARARGAEVHTAILCVTARDQMAAWLTEADERKPVDLVIANAGISAGMGDGLEEGAEQVRRLFDVNVTGVFNTIDPLLPRMIARRYGSVALMASLAGFRGWPGAPAYCATKAAVKVYGEGLRGALAQSGVNVHVICPGFVRSRMTDVNKFPMPFIMDADKAAVIIARGIAANKGRIAFPAVPHFVAWFCNILSDGTAQRILRLMPKKKADAV